MALAILDQERQPQQRDYMFNKALADDSAAGDEALWAFLGTPEQAASATGTEFCNGCHHPEGDPTQPWIPQHFGVVAQTGAEPCFECHDPTYCAECHVQGSVQ